MSGQKYHHNSSIAFVYLDFSKQINIWRKKWRQNIIFNWLVLQKYFGTSIVLLLSIIFHSKVDIALIYLRTWKKCTNPWRKWRSIIVQKSKNVQKNMNLHVIWQDYLNMGPFINDITYLGGGVICQMMTLLYKPNLVKWVTGEGLVKYLKKWVTLFIIKIHLT